MRQLNVAKIGLLGLTPGQIEALTVAQIQSLKPKDIAQLLPSQTKSLTAGQWTALTGAVANSAAPATQQVGHRTVGQIRAMQPWQFDELTPAQVPFLTALQIAGTSGSWHFEQMSDEARAALTSGQVKALMTGSTGIDWLTGQQETFLSVVQIQSLLKWGVLVAQPDTGHHPDGSTDRVGRQ